MLNEKKSKRGMVIALLCALALLALVILLENTMKPTGMLFTVLKKGAVYSLVAVSMNLLNGFTGLFSLGQAGFMLLGAYSYAILTIPVAKRAGVYQYFDGGWIQFSLPEIFSGKNAFHAFVVQQMQCVPGDPPLAEFASGKAHGCFPIRGRHGFPFQISHARSACPTSMS